MHRRERKMAAASADNGGYHINDSKTQLPFSVRLFYKMFRNRSLQQQTVRSHDRITEEFCQGHEIVNINLRSKPDWFFEKNPKGLVPTIETSDGKIIYESSIVCDYLDDAFPGKKLTPADPYEKAQQKILLEHFSETLVKRNSPYIGGESLTMIDYMIWPWFEQFQMDVREVLEKMPHINAWYKRMLKDPAVKKTFTEPEVFNGFFQIYESLDAADYGLD
ncbi:unnamed protein product [Ranitomeya imitator]|uniref:Glutathione-dependent dehydroascorbate reductase n=1 Tax=Ranitomeya imitator TaxID=111125 RepID=A0ABN9MIH7_9NEOB|nr:unnamed protein product [Ranitomeya imitator]